MKFIGTFFDLCQKLIKNGGMESVTSLPTTNNFEGREVNYKGTKYIYYNGAWVNQRDAEKLGGLDSSLYITNPRETVIGESNYKIYDENQIPSENYIDTFYSPLIWASPDNFTIEYSDDGEIFTEIEKTDPVYNIRFYLNSSYYIKFTTHPYYRITVPFNATVPIRGMFYGLVLSGWNYYIDRCLIEELQGEVWNIIADEQQNNYTQGYYAVEFKSHYLYSQIDSSHYCQSLRVTLKGRHISNNTSYGVTGIALLSNYYKALSGIRNYFRPTNGILTSPFSLDSQETLNYDVNNIKPTQTGTVKKSSSWIWQYLVQSVNWLRDNFNNFLSKRMHEHIYLNCDWLNIRTSVTGAIILKTPFQNIGDGNNSMTFIELSVISHKAPTCVAKYIFYLYKYKPDVINYEQKYYSVLGPQIFSNIYIGALQDNSTVIVLGDFTDTYKNFTVSIDRVVTSFNRTSDDTDKFSLYVESDESVLQYKAKFNLQSAFAKGYSVPDGTDSQFLKADGSIDNNEYAPKAHTHNGTDSERIDYNNLENKPDIPEVGNGTITIKQGSTTIDSFSVNQAANKTITLPENSNLPIASETVLGGIKSSGSISVDPTTGVAKVLNNSHNHTASNITGLSTVATTGDYDDLENKPTIYTSATINGVNVDFSADNNIIPSYITFNNVLYPFRFTGSAFQIYRNGVWADLVNFDNFISNDRGIITESNMEDWYRPGINEYFIDESAAVNFLTLKKPLAPPEKWTNITINTGTLTNKITGLKSTVLLDNIRTNIKNVFGEEPYTLYTEYDISAMLDSGFGYKLVLKLEKGTAESNSVIVECYKVW